MKVCVFSSSSEKLAEPYQLAAVELGKLTGSRNYELVYGGSQRGLMGINARAHQAAGGKTIGVLPARFRDAAGGEDQLIRVSDFPERVAKMKELSDCFFCLAGGFGTLFEFSDVLQAKQFNDLSSSLVLINTQGFYDEFDTYLRKTVKQGFAPEDNYKLWYLAKNPQDALDYAINFKPTIMRAKLSPIGLKPARGIK